MEKLMGKVTHYFTKLGVAVIKLEDELKVNDDILIKGATTNFEQKVESMEIYNKPVSVAKKGQSIGLKVKDRVREKDLVYKLLK